MMHLNYITHFNFFFCLCKVVNALVFNFIKTAQLEVYYFQGNACELRVVIMIAC